jgi:serine/threonine protein kinase
VTRTLCQSSFLIAGFLGRVCRADLEALVQAGQGEVRQAAEAVAAQEAADQPAEARLALTSYLSQMPASIRQSLRRPSDPGGATAPASLSLRKPEDLLPFLPAGLPRFKPGDRPLAADWELVELLGKGGFGEVWKARHLTRSRQRPVALKFCLDAEAAATLRNEAALHDHLDRVREGSLPGIVPLLETYLRADPPCLMYDYIEGCDLAGLVRDLHGQGSLPAGFARGPASRVVQRLASIVGIAHRLDPPLVHRDLKLSNVLVRQGGGDPPELFVADFGIGALAAGQALREQARSRPLSCQVTAAAILGAYTPLYASRQQVRGEPPDPRDDVHALGVIWYQLCTGDLTMLSIPPNWRKVVEELELGEERADLLGACISARAAERPVDAAKLAERLAWCPVEQSTFF